MTKTIHEETCLEFPITDNMAAKAVEVEKYFGAYFRYNLPVQMSHNDDGELMILNYQARHEKLAWETVREAAIRRPPKRVVKLFCEVVQEVLNNLGREFVRFAEKFDKNDSVYYANTNPND